MSAQEDTAAQGVHPPRRKLGKGLGALLGEARREEPLVRPSRNSGEDGATAAPRTVDGAARVGSAAALPPNDAAASTIPQSLDRYHRHGWPIPCVGRKK